MAIQALVTTEGAAAANAANASGFTITIPQFSMSATAGTLAASRTFANKNAVWFSAAVTTVTTVSATTVKYTCVIPAGSSLAATAINEIYLEDTTGVKLYVVAQPDVATPIVYDPAGSVTIEIDVTIASIPSSSYNLVNTSAVDLATHENNVAMHPKTNYGATTIPTVNDDAAAGYNEGSIWVNTLTNVAYVLTDKTNGAAVWSQFAPQTAGIQNNFAAASAPTIANDSSQGYSIGSVWIDNITDKVYTASDVTAGAAVWTQTGGTSVGAVVQATAPLAPAAGIVWLNTATDVTYVFDGNAWIDISAAGAGFVQNNYAAAADPTNLADTNAGYAIGSTWVNAATGSTYIATAVTAGAAVWSRFGGAIEWFNVAANYIAAANIGVFADSTLIPLTVTLPATPVLGDRVIVADSKSTAATNNITVVRNGNTVNGLAADFIISAAGQISTFYFTGSDWRVSTSFATAATSLLNNYTAITPPTAADDSVAGYGVGSMWVDTATQAVYQNTDATAATAIWKRLSVAGKYTAAGTANVLTATGAQAQSGDVFQLVPLLTNTGAVTLSIAGEAPKSITKNGVALIAGELVAGTTILIEHLGASYGISETNALGVGQQWTDVSVSRAAGVTYTNTTGRPIVGLNRINLAAGATNFATISILVNGISVVISSAISATPSGGIVFVQAVIPHGATYSYNHNIIGTTISIVWKELR